jgi:hypothetical protein
MSLAISTVLMIINIMNDNNFKYLNAINDFNTFKELSDTGICFNHKLRFVRMLVNLSPAGVENTVVGKCRVLLLLLVGRY